MIKNWGNSAEHHINVFTIVVSIMKQNVTNLVN